MLLLSYRGIAVMLVAMGAACGSGGRDENLPMPTPSAVAAVTPTAIGAATPVPTPASVIVPVIWAAADRHIVRSDDGGRTWSGEVLLHPARARGVDFVDRDHGWVVGSGVDHGEIRATRDGGDSWEDQRGNFIGGGALPSLLDVAFMNSRIGVAVGGGPPPRGSAQARRPVAILSTTNGGATWVRARLDGLKDSERDGVLSDACLTAGGLGLAVSPGRLASDPPRVPLALLTEDGGHRWASIVDRLPEAGFVGTACVDERELWMVGGATIVHSPDGGVTWIDLSDALPPDVRLVDVDFLDARTGWLAAAHERSRRALVLHTTDGGRTWVTQVLAEVRPGLRAIDFIDAARGVAVGSESRRNPNNIFSDWSFPLSFATDDGGGSWSPGTRPDSRVPGDVRGVTYFADVDIVP